MSLKFKRIMILEEQIEFEDVFDKMTCIIKEGTSLFSVLSTIVKQGAALLESLKQPTTPNSENITPPPCSFFYSNQKFY